MRTAFTTFLILSFIGVAVFSMLVMGYDAEHGHNGCIAAVASLGFDCQKVSGVLSFIGFHFDAFRSFSTAVIFALILVIAAGINIGIYLSLPALAADYYRRRFFESFSFPFQRKFIRWLALHENSPTVYMTPI